jgi:NAD(P)-dependent dehydrogenase (short-subunit alcohol dehydrogenase family)
MIITLSSFVLLLFTIYILYFFRKILNSPKSPIKSNMTGKLVIVTGATSGMGMETAKELLQQGAEVVLASRNKEKAEEIISETSNKNAEFIELDLRSLDSIKKFVDEFKRRHSNLDILVLNAINIRHEYLQTAEGFENTVGANYIGHFMLTLMLLPLFNREGRVITVTSLAFEWATNDTDKIRRLMDTPKEDYHVMKQYSINKLCLSSFAQHLAKYFDSTNKHIKSVHLHPGFVNTNAFKQIDAWYSKGVYYLFYPFVWYFYKDQYIGAQTILYLCYLPYQEVVNGAYYADCKMAYTPKDKKKEELINTVMRFTKELVYSKIPKEKIPEEVVSYFEHCK